MRRTCEVILLGALLVGCEQVRPNPTQTPIEVSSTSSSVSSAPEDSVPNIFDPSRVTKKPFGIHITLEDSPVQPERFSGYHTGADFEVLPGEDETLITVSAICNGPVVLARRMDGYGGVLIQQCAVDRETIMVLYGHLALSSVAAVDADLAEGEVVGHLGRGYSDETDGERPHLHLSIHRGDAVELRGYAQQESDLEAWIDPLSLKLGESLD